MPIVKQVFYLGSSGLAIIGERDAEEDQDSPREDRRLDRLAEDHPLEQEGENWYQVDENAGLGGSDLLDSAVVERKADGGAANAEIGKAYPVGKGNGAEPGEEPGFSRG